MLAPRFTCKVGARAFAWSGAGESLLETIPLGFMKSPASAATALHQHNSPIIS